MKPKTHLLNEYPPKAYETISEAMKRTNSTEISKIVTELEQTVKSKSNSWYRRLEGQMIFTTGDIKNIIEQLEKEKAV
jgi:hypothetical protein